MIYQIDLDLNAFLTIYRPLNLQFWRLYREEKISKEDLRYQRLKTAFDAVNFEVSDELVNILAEKYIAFLPHFNHLFEGAFEILDYLHSKYQLHIITNGFDEVQRKKMKSSKIDHYFKQVITSESVGVKKPNPRVFEHAIKVANATKENAIMIGDSLEADIEGAVNYGLKAIYCNFDGKDKQSDQFITITSLFELKKYL